MKKIFLILIIIFLIITFSITALLLNKRNRIREIAKYNKEYEYYLNKEIYGTEVASLINKVIDLNEKSNVKKDEKNYFIEDNNSIKIQIKMKLTEKTYPMEEIYNTDTAEFVKYFNLVKFKCTSIEYNNSTGKVKGMFFEEI